MKNLLLALAVAGSVVTAGAVVAQQSQPPAPGQSQQKAPMPGGNHMMHGGGMPMDAKKGEGMQGGGMMCGQGGMGCGMMQGMQPGGNHQGMNMPVKGDRSPSSLAFHAVNAKMHAEMDIAFTGDADRDFTIGMIAHHQGAIDMAKVVVAFGNDPEVKKLAEQIIQDQEKEVSWMRTWLERTKK